MIRVIIKKAVLALILTALSLANCAKEPEHHPIRFDPDRFDITTAGGGKLDPNVDWDLGRLILIHLHKGLPLSNIALSGQASLGRIYTTVAKMKQSGFVKEKGEEELYPGILVVTGEDSAVVRSSARDMGALLADEIERRWSDVMGMYEKLEVSGRFPWERLGFWIIGARLLDDAMIKALYRDGTVLPEPPERPSGSSGKARYYCWMEERDSGIGIPYRQWVEMNPNYLMGTFGVKDWEWRHFWKVMWGIRRSLGREVFFREFLPCQERRARDLGYVPENPDVVGALEEFPYKIPVVGFRDMGVIQGFVESFSDTLVGLFRDNKGGLMDTFSQATAGSYALFAEFFRWHYHQIFCQAIGDLVDRGLLVEPEDRFEYWVMLTR